MGEAAQVEQDQQTIDETVDQEAKDAQPAEAAQDKDSENFPDKPAEE